MKDFKELVGLLGKKPLPLDDTQLGLRARALYHYIRRVAEPTDKGAARKLQLARGSNAYRKVKHHLKYALLDGITTVKRKPLTASNRPAAASNCWSTIALARSTPQAYELLPRDLIDHQLKQTQAFDLLEAASQLTDILADRPAIGPEITHYLERSDYLGGLGYSTASILSFSFHITFLRNQNENGLKIAALALDFHKKAMSLSQGYNYEKIDFNTKFLELQHYLALGDYQCVVNTCKSILENFSKKEYVGKDNTMNMIEINLLNAYTQLGSFEEGIAIVKKLLHKIPSNKLNYIKVQEASILLSLRTGNFQSAYDLYHKYDIEKVRIELPEYFAETIDIYKAYIFLSIDLGEIRKKSKDEIFTNFRLQRFINNFRHSQKEKSSRNIHIVLVRLIREMIANSVKDPIDNVLAAEKYARRHLKGIHRQRSKLFISALAYITKHGLSEKSLISVDQKYIEKIKELPVRGAHHHSNLEVIRYDILFNSIVKRLNH